MYTQRFNTWCITVKLCSLYCSLYLSRNKEIWYIVYLLYYEVGSCIHSFLQLKILENLQEEIKVVVELMRLKNIVGRVCKQTECEFLERDLHGFGRTNTGEFRRESTKQTIKSETKQKWWKKNHYEFLAFRYVPTVDYAGNKSIDLGIISIICIDKIVISIKKTCDALRFRH